MKKRVPASAFLFFGPKFSKPGKHKSMLLNMCKGLNAVWHDGSFLLFRLFRLALALVQFVLPHNLLCLAIEPLARLLGSENAGYRSLYWVTDLYIVAKLMVPLFILHQSWIMQVWVYWLCFGLTVESIVYILGNVFIPGRAASNLRSPLMLLLSYFAVTASFACMYFGQGHINGLDSPGDAIFFSFITSSTMTYGDMEPTTSFGQSLVVFQVVTSALFIIAFFPVFFSRMTTARSKDLNC
jgi:hypothetical protein